MRPEGGPGCIHEGFSILRAPESIKAFPGRLYQAQRSKGLHGRLAHRLGNVEGPLTHCGEREVFLARHLQ